MRDILNQIELASGANIYYVALFSALSVPDICAALESTDGRASGPRYAAWFDRWVGPRYMNQGVPILSGEACYAYRCAVLHQARAAHQNLGYERGLFVEPSGFMMHKNIMNGALNIDVRVFCSDIIAGARAWLEAVEATAQYQTNWQASMKRHPEGLAPYIGGVPVIG